MVGIGMVGFGMVGIGMDGIGMVGHRGLLADIAEIVWFEPPIYNENKTIIQLA